MALEKKHIILIVGGVLILSAIGVGLYLLFNKPDDATDNPEDEKKGKDDPEDDPQTKAPNPTPAIDPYKDSIKNGKVIPIYNEENELINPYQQLKGKVLYPLRKAQGGWDYTNVRTSAEVNTESAWYDPFDNLLTTINAGTPIGYVEGETAGVYNDHSYRWFKVKLIKPVGFWGTKEGYVRADTVIFPSYEL